MDEEETVTEEEEGEEPSAVREQTEKLACKQQRICDLATPNKRILLALWNEHAHHFPPEKVNYIKQLIQQSYAMSPEQTAKYFAELRAEAKAAADRRKLKQKLRKHLLAKRHQNQRERAYKLFKRILKSGIRYAATTPVPPLLSIRLRYLSDIILQQLCDLRGLKVPNRTNQDNLSIFLISVSDWMAIAVERLYYSTQLSINEMVAEHREATVPDEKIGPPVASSTPRSSQQGQQLRKGSQSPQVPDSFSQMGPPLASSSPRGSVQSKVKSAAQPETKIRVTDYTAQSVQQSDQRSADFYPTAPMQDASLLQNKQSIDFENVLPYYSVIRPPDVVPTTASPHNFLTFTGTYNPQELESTLNQIRPPNQRSKKVSRNIGNKRNGSPSGKSFSKVNRKSPGRNPNERNNQRWL